MGKDGVSARVIAEETGGRDENGRFLPGHSLGKLGGRPRKAQELAILDSIRSTFPPDVVAEKLRKAMQLAEEQNSARGMVAVLEFAANYTLGKPVQRIQQESSGIVGIMAELGINIEE
jgi:hypothetical protein